VGAGVASTTLSIMAILNTNAYRTGFDAGIAAAESGKEKDYRSVAKSWKTWVWGSPAMDTFIQGYDEGYAKGLAKVHGVYTKGERAMQGGPSGTSGGSSGGMHALADSDAIEGLIAELQRFGPALREGDRRAPCLRPGSPRGRAARAPRVPADRYGGNSR